MLPSNRLSFLFRSRYRNAAIFVYQWHLNFSISPIFQMGFHEAWFKNREADRELPANEVQLKEVLASS